MNFDENRTREWVAATTRPREIFIKIYGSIKLFYFILVK